MRTGLFNSKEWSDKSTTFLVRRFPAILTRDFSITLTKDRAMFRSRAATGMALTLALLGNQPAGAFCVLGYGDTHECRWLVPCEKRGASRGSCTCSYDLAKQGFPPDQLATAVDVFEAFADNDQTRKKLIESRLGFGAIEFMSRLSAVMDAASARCGR